VPFFPPLVKEVKSIEIEKKHGLGLVDSVKLHVNRFNLSRLRRLGLLHLQVAFETSKFTLLIGVGWWGDMLLILVSVVLGFLWCGLIGVSLVVLASQSWLWFLMAKDHIRKMRIKKTEGWEVEKEDSEEALNYLAKTKKI
jgi:hypothetical protein